MQLFKNNIWVLVILSVGLIIRLYRINLPLLDAKPHREIHTAEETRNLYYDWELMYPKSKLWADEPGYYLAEFPLYNSVVATLYRTTGSVDETWGKLVSVASSVAVALIFFTFVTDIFNPTIALLSLTFFYLFSPQEIILSRNFQPDQFGLFFGIASVYFFFRWIKGKSFKNYIYSFIFFTITLLVKVQFFSFGAPIIYLAIAKWKKKVFKKPFLYFYLFTLLPFFFWWRHIKIVYETFPNLHSAPLLNPTGWIDLSIFTNVRWYINVGFDFVEEITTLPVFLLALIGLFMKTKYDTKILYAWYGGLFLYILLFIGKFHFWYYQVPLLFPTVIFASLAASKLYEKLKSYIYYPRFLSIIFLLFAALITARPYVFRAYIPADRHKEVLQTAKFVRNNALPNAKIITSSYNSAVLTYYSLRSDMWGATFDINEGNCTGICTIKQFKKLIDWGGQLYAVSDKSEFSKNPVFLEYLNKTFPKLLETENAVIFNFQN